MARKFIQEEEPVEKIPSYTPLRTKNVQKSSAWKKIVLYIIISFATLVF
jgi:hypothetical protein